MEWCKKFSTEEKTGLILALLLIVGACMWNSPEDSPKEQLRPNMAIIQGNSFLPISSPFYPVTSVLASQLSYRQGEYGGQCVSFVQYYLDAFAEIKYEDHPFKGYAWKIMPNSTEPKVGRAILFETHVAAIIGIDGDYLELIESNLNRDELITVGRFVDKNDETIRGYFDFSILEP